MSSAGSATIGGSPQVVSIREPRRVLRADRSSERPGLLISIQPRFASAILAGEKWVELRRRAPKVETPIVVIYGSGTARRVLGTARLTSIYTATPAEVWRRYGPATGVTRGEFDAYFAGSVDASALVLAEAVSATSPLSLEALRMIGLEPPQSWRYVDEDQLGMLLAAIHPDPAAAGERDAAIFPPPGEGRLRVRTAFRAVGRDWSGLKPTASTILECVSLRSPRRRDVLEDDVVAIARAHDARHGTLPPATGKGSRASQALDL